MRSSTKYQGNRSTLSSKFLLKSRGTRYIYLLPSWTCLCWLCKPKLPRDTCLMVLKPFFMSNWKNTCGTTFEAILKCWNSGHLSQQAKEVSIAFFFHYISDVITLSWWQTEFAMVQILYQMILSCIVSCKFSLGVLEIIVTHLVLLSDRCLPSQNIFMMKPAIFITRLRAGNGVGVVGCVEGNSLDYWLIILKLVLSLLSGRWLTQEGQKSCKLFFLVLPNYLSSGGEGRHVKLPHFI